MSRPSEPTRKKTKPTAVDVAAPVPAASGAGAPAPIPTRIETYEQALAFLDTRTNVERTRPSKVDPRVWKLDRMRALVDALGNPQRAVKFVHIAGSKGKGSTCEMVASCLSACGYATGLYTSPHLVDLRERIRIGREMISKSAFAEHIAKVASVLPGVEKKFGEVTFFECVTAVALCHFASEAVDVAVMEVGLGGRLDSTNIIDPEVCGITSIQLEHKEILGDTVEKIAREKAGIMKPGVTCLTVPQKPGVIEVFKEVAAASGAELRVLGENGSGIDFSHRFEASPEIGPHIKVNLSTSRSNFEHLPVPLRGEHQAFNCGLALAILDKLKDRGFEIREREVAKGLAGTPNHGRMEVIATLPRVVVDGAHNPESVHGLMRAIGAHMKYDSMVVIFGCAADKDVPGMLAKVALGADKIIFTKATGHARGVEPRELQRRFAEVSHKMAQIAPSVKDAIVMASHAVTRDDLICVTGSFYLAGEAKKLLLAAKKG
ncbi:MAG: folylpolyglutamate synthase/dihydrofolate synthase family protein [Planctomycetota bacterium]|nr:folylpolyglutamate synthase/dihydrofolate synthase family protein [Planctomycetota bacterium]